MTIQRFLSIAFVVTLLTACSGFHKFEEVRTLNTMQKVGSPFTQKLAMEYRDFVDQKIEGVHDHADGLHFARKGVAAGKGHVVLPEPITDWNLLPVHMQELGNARARLIKAFDFGAREMSPETAAIAQARFDCWIELQEEDWQAGDVSSCKNEFMAALSRLESAMHPVAPPPPPAPLEAAFDVDPSKPMEPENSMYLVFFDFDKHNLSQGAKSVLDAVAKEVNGRSISALNIVGHADTVGTNEYNRSLAMKRANEIRGALIQRNVDPGLIRVESRGEEDLMVPTPDNVREPANRRGEISFE